MGNEHITRQFLCAVWGASRQSGKKQGNWASNHIFQALLHWPVRKNTCQSRKVLGHYVKTGYNGLTELWQAVKAQDTGAEITSEEEEKDKGQQGAEERQVKQSLTAWSQNFSWGLASTYRTNRILRVFKLSKLTNKTTNCQTFEKVHFSCPSSLCCSLPQHWGVSSCWKGVRLCHLHQALARRVSHGSLRRLVI